MKKQTATVNTDLAALCRKTPGPMGLSFTQKPVLLK